MKSALLDRCVHASYRREINRLRAEWAIDTVTTCGPGLFGWRVRWALILAWLSDVAEVNATEAENALRAYEHDEGVMCARVEGGK